MWRGFWTQELQDYICSFEGLISAYKRFTLWPEPTCSCSCGFVKLIVKCILKNYPVFSMLRWFTGMSWKQNENWSRDKEADGVSIWMRRKTKKTLHRSFNFDRSQKIVGRFNFLLLLRTCRLKSGAWPMQFCSTMRVKVRWDCLGPN